MHYLLVYDTAADYLQRRAQLRSSHLAHAWSAVDRGELLLGGTVGDPVDSAVLLFSGESPAAAERFAETDPYVTGGLVTRWRVKPWSTVVGADAASPMRPEAPGHRA
jgi:uncharacterized protein YciI